MDYVKLEEEFKTPFCLYDFDLIKSHFLQLKNVFKAEKSQVFYAMKANSSLSLLQMLARLDSGFDCVSIGEAKRALRVGAKPYEIIFSGVGKSKEELEQALKSDILYINSESEEEMLLSENVAKRLGLKARISIGVNPNVDAKMHPYIPTGLNEDKFGVEFEVARKMYLYATKSEFLGPIGTHFYIGSQLLDINPIHDAALIVAKLLRELKALKIEFKFFDVGGGLGVGYEGEEEPRLYHYAQGTLANLSGLDVTMGLKPGRLLVAKSGVFVRSVLYEKITPKKRFMVVDAAMNDLIRPSLYDAYHEIVSPYTKGEVSPCDVIGGICEGEDFFTKDRRLTKSKSGNIVLTKEAGAYGFSMSSNYSTRPRTCEPALENGAVKMVRKREEFEDLIALEEEFLENL